MKRLLNVLFAATLCSILFQSSPRAYTLLPAPKKVLFTGTSFPASSDRVVLSSVFKSHDPRILKSLKNIFPSSVVFNDKLPMKPGGTVIYAASAPDAVTKKLCPQLKCSDIDIKKIPNQGYFLGIKKTNKGNVVLILASDVYGEFYATKTLAQIYENGTLTETFIYDWPDFRARGVLEGFYGKPWPDASRRAMLPWMSAYKFNIYIYAPKDDYKLRLGWRLNFSEKELSRVKDTNAIAHDNFIKYCWELSPGMSVAFSRDKDAAAAIKKFRTIINAGTDCIALAFDDVGLQLAPDDRGKFKTYEEGQMYFTNKVLGELYKEFPDLMVAFVPNDYWAALAEESEYLRYIGKHLDPRVQIGYTGNEIIPATITGSDVKYYQSFIRRKPIMGDNYPVSDYVNDGGRLSLGPLRGRDANLFRYIDVFVANAMPLPESSKPALLTIADYVWNPMQYDPDDSWGRALNILGGGAQGADALSFFAKQSESSLIWKHDALELFETTRGLMRAYKDLPDYDFDEYAGKAEKMFARFEGIGAEIEALRGPQNTAMLDEIKPWISKLSGYGSVGLETVKLLKLKKSGSTPETARIDELEARWKKTDESKAIITKMVMANFMIQSLAALRDQPEPDLKKYKSIIE